MKAIPEGRPRVRTHTCRPACTDTYVDPSDRASGAHTHTHTHTHTQTHTHARSISSLSQILTCAVWDCADLSVSTRDSADTTLVCGTGAKLFYLTGLRNGKYKKREVLNLARFISVMKFRPLSWRQAHPYLIVDRFEVRAPHHVRVGLLRRLFIVKS